MAKYNVQLNFNATIEVIVEANDEGEALGKARELAEDADITEFVLNDERESVILSVQ